MTDSTKPVGSSTELQISLDPFFTDVINKDDGSYRVSQSFAQDDLPSGVQLYVRVRHGSDRTGRSDWSPYVRFSIEIPASVIGVAINLETHNVDYIDVLGNKVTTFNPDTHPVFVRSSMAVLDSKRSEFLSTKIPLFYIKTMASGPIGTFAEGKPCFWISDMPHEGFRPHPAFKRSARRDSFGKYTLSNYIYIGTYLGHRENVSGRTVLGSKKNQVVCTGKKMQDLISLAVARNDAASSEEGYFTSDIYVYSLMRWLGIIRSGTFDFQTAFGANKVDHPRTGSTQARLVLRGTHGSPQVYIDDCWDCYWQYADLLNITDGVVTLRSPMDRASALTISGAPINYTITKNSGWVKEFLSASFVLGDDIHDILELFLPKLVGNSSKNVAIPDYHTYSVKSDTMKLGGDWSVADKGGLFCDTLEREYTVETVHHPGTEDQVKMTAYCGNVIYCNTSSKRVTTSVGLGKVATSNYTGKAPQVCNGSYIGQQGDNIFAPCDTTGEWDVMVPCPKGWGNKSNKNGCYNGTQYKTVPGEEGWDEVKENISDRYAVRVSKC